MDFPTFFRRATNQDPFPFQSALATRELPDLLAAPTGFGKTEAIVLAWLWRRMFGTGNESRSTPSRLIYCLPMRVLVEQTADRVRACLHRLRDGTPTANFPDPERDVHTLLGGAVSHDWEGTPERTAILIGTQDQLLSRALNRGYGMSRFMWPVHFGLLHNDCHWVLDEVQLMGVGLSTSVQLQAFREHLATFGSARSTWMSATLDRSRLNTVDMRVRPWTEASPTDLDRRHPALLARWQAAKPVSRAASKAGDAHACAEEIVAAHVEQSFTLVVVNQVRRAQELYAALKERCVGTPVRLLHSRFRPADRRAVQTEVLADGWQGVLVATQAIEAGVDVSARTLFTELAPWSSLVQRFGRLNRRGEFTTSQACARWFDFTADDDAAIRPYEAKDITAARDRLRCLTDAGPASLATDDPKPPTLPVIRRRDLLQLFDTEPDLAGHDIDVSQYIRSTTDVDVQVAWREWHDEEPCADAPELQRDELCLVAVHQVQKLCKGSSVWRWNGLHGSWERVHRLMPGMIVLLPTSMGGYDPELGWTGNRRDLPAAVTALGPAPDQDEADTFTFACSAFVTLRDHAQDTAEEMVALRDQLPLESLPWPVLVDAARWHDLGKAHEAFQAMLVGSLDASDPRRQGGPWAKSDHRNGRNLRRHFRHELASALALLQQGGSDLQAYLVAAHHGKVRLTVRARPLEQPAPEDRLFALGVWDGDQLPEVDLGAGQRSPATTLSLDYMQLGNSMHGPSWLDRTARLLEDLGPFRLAFLETLVRVADWRATARRRAAQPAAEVHRG